jgi:hypothetical protein
VKFGSRDITLEGAQESRRASQEKKLNAGQPAADVRGGTPQLF